MECDHKSNGKYTYYVRDIGLTCHEYIAICSMCDADISDEVDEAMSWNDL